MATLPLTSNPYLTHTRPLYVHLTRISVWHSRLSAATLRRTGIALKSGHYLGTWWTREGVSQHYGGEAGWILPAAGQAEPLFGEALYEVKPTRWDPVQQDGVLVWVAAPLRRKLN